MVLSTSLHELLTGFTSGACCNQSNEFDIILTVTDVLKAHEDQEQRSGLVGLDYSIRIKHSYRWHHYVL
jgi:hypothetical protein